MPEAVDERGLLLGYALKTFRALEQFCSPEGLTALLKCTVWMTQQWSRIKPAQMEPWDLRREHPPEYWLSDLVSEEGDLSKEQREKWRRTIDQFPRDQLSSVEQKLLDNAQRRR